MNNNEIISIAFQSSMEIGAADIHSIEPKMKNRTFNLIYSGYEMQNTVEICRNNIKPY